MIILRAIVGLLDYWRFDLIVGVPLLLMLAAYSIWAARPRPRPYNQAEHRPTFDELDLRETAPAWESFWAEHEEYGCA